MSWDDGLLPEQVIAARHVGGHARLLAGPGTGKTLTLTRHVRFLIEHQEIDPKRILAVTFTRAAAFELRQRIIEGVGEERCPRISTLHSFALRQLLRNTDKVAGFPEPLRIADDWEERNIILEDLKSLLDLDSVDMARNLLNELSSDWQSLTADEENWEVRFPNPVFLGAWREHRRVYGYALRAELVYQLKKALEQHGDFVIENSPEHLLVDEYQDLNRCDIAVIDELANRGAILYVAGDDDQSIYGFRKAHPEGIRRFSDDHPGTSGLELERCKRCDQRILDLGLFVACQDPRRLHKRIMPPDEMGANEVEILRFADQEAEALGIAGLCCHLIESHGLKPDDILILLRSNRRGVFSGPIAAKLHSVGIEAVTRTEADTPFEEDDGRILLAMMRLAVDFCDSLAWRTLLKLRCKGIGPLAVSAVYDVARSQGLTFSGAISAIEANPELLASTHRKRILRAIIEIKSALALCFPEADVGNCTNIDEVMTLVRNATERLIADPELEEAAWREISASAFGDTQTLADLVRSLEVATDDLEQERVPGMVNILTMHRAKGLTAEAVIIAAVEDQSIPGRASGEAMDDERRLLYVSLTRAKHHLFVTYCDKRTGQQMYTGRDSGRLARRLSSFLADCPHTPRNGSKFVLGLFEDEE